MHNAPRISAASQSWPPAGRRGRRRRSRVPTDGTISSIAGTTPGFAGDGGPANQAKIDAPSDVAFVATNSYLIADFDNNRIRQVDAQRQHHHRGRHRPGLVRRRRPRDRRRPRPPRGRDLDSAGGGYLIADTRNHRIRRVGADGIITTFAGTDQGLAGDGGPATAARLTLPSDTAAAGRRLAS